MSNPPEPSGAANPHIILVAGFDYEFNNVSFRTLCDNRMDRLLKVFPNATFVIFDVAAGEVFKSQPSNTSSKGGRTTTVDTKTFKPVTSKNYSVAKKGEENHFDTNPSGIMSITDVYRAIIKLGASKATRGSLGEFSIFSHGWREGAILVNSDDGSNSTSRDPDDKDTRNKDFKNFTADELKHFKQAFAPKGIGHLWGCSFTDIYFQLVVKTTATSKFRKTVPEKLKDTDEFELTYTQDQADNFYSDDPNFYPQPKKGKSRLAFKRNLKQIKTYLRTALNQNYAHVLAKASGRKCFAAYPGTSAAFEDHDKKAKLPLMLIPRRKPPFDSNFTREINFYKKVMRIPEDPEHRGYGTYSP